MAFCSKFGGLIRQGFSNASSIPTPMFNAVRYFSNSKLFVGGLSFGTDDMSLKEAFNSFGTVVEAKVITDRDSGRSKGFGFVSFDDSESAKNAMSSMDGQELQGRNIRVSFANDRPSGGFRGGYGGDSGGFRGSGGY